MQKIEEKVPLQKKTLTQEFEEEEDDDDDEEEEEVG